MSRRNAAEKRPVLPDPQFNSRLASMIVARLMKHGKNQRPSASFPMRFR
jgi:small subunit ribosomal protein S7